MKFQISRTSLQQNYDDVTMTSWTSLHQGLKSRKSWKLKIPVITISLSEVKNCWWSPRICWWSPRKKKNRKRDRRNNLLWQIWTTVHHSGRPSTILRSATCLFRWEPWSGHQDTSDLYPSPRAFFYFYFLFFWRSSFFSHLTWQRYEDRVTANFLSRLE